MMENDLFNMFKHMDFGSIRPSDLMAQLLQQYELSILTMMRQMIDQRMQQIGGTQPGQKTAGIPDDMNPFTILGVGMDATEAEVKAAYRKRAAEAHPDRGGSNEWMAKVNAAYEVIKKFHGWK
jgi:DnaJ-class molecular chaperone